MEAEHMLSLDALCLGRLAPRDDDLPRLLLTLQLPFELSQPNEVRHRGFRFFVLGLELFLYLVEERTDCLSPVFGCSSCLLVFHLSFSSQKSGRSVSEAPVNNSLLPQNYQPVR